MIYKLPLSKWSRLERGLKDKNVTYEFKEGRNDGFMYKSDDENGLSSYHIHSIEKAEDDNMVFHRLLVKDSNWRGGAEPDLVNFPTSEWGAICSTMNSSVRHVVQALADCFDSLSASSS